MIGVNNLREPDAQDIISITLHMLARKFVERQKNVYTYSSAISWEDSTIEFVFHGKYKRIRNDHNIL